jgi:predicted dinucleotide-binding enzyme
VKAWNHVYAQIVDSSPEFGSESATVFMCGDDAEAKRVVAGLMVGLAYGVGMGTDQALKQMRR